MQHWTIYRQKEINNDHDKASFLLKKWICEDWTWECNDVYVSVDQYYRKERYWPSNLRRWSSYRLIELFELSDYLDERINFIPGRETLSYQYLQSRRLHNYIYK